VYRRGIEGNGKEREERRERMGRVGVCTRASALDPPLLAPVYDVQY